jgi:protein SCO1/2
MRGSRSRSDARRALGLLVAVCCGGWVALGAEPQAARPLKRATRSSVEVTLPEIALERDDGKRVSLSTELNDGRPVLLTFIFTKCGTICPVMSQTFSQVQDKLGEREPVHLVSISIDPEYDTPARLAEYGKKVGAGARWHFYTGTTEASVAAQRAFEAFRGDKMSHTPVTFLRGRAGKPWERIDGFASSDELIGELRQLLAVR